MKVLWFISGSMPIVHSRIGLGTPVNCGWLSSMLRGLVQIASDLKLCVVSIDRLAYDFCEGNVRYVSFGVKDIRMTYDRIPVAVEDRARYLIREFNPDVIHVQGTEYFYGCMSPNVYCGKPVVVSLQGVVSGCYPHYNGGIAPFEVWWEKFTLRWLIGHNTLFGVQKLWASTRLRQEMRTLRQQTYFIGRTEWDRDWVRYYNPKAKYYHIDENLRPPFYNTRRDVATIKRHSIYCGAAAGYPLKGVHWLLKAVATLKDDFPDIQLRIANAQRRLGCLSLKQKIKAEAYTIYLRRLIKSLGLENYVVSLPPLLAENVADELKNAELFVLPSLCENSPNSLGEAMLVGTPPIATFVGGIPSILKDGVEGRLIPSSDPAALAGAIRRWFEHPEDAEACVVEARKTALTRHDAKTNAKNTIAVYHELMECEK